MFAVMRLEVGYLRPILMIVPIMMIFGLAPLLLMGQVGVGSAFLVMLPMILIMFLFSLSDSGVGPNALLGTLPVGRRQVIVVRYMMALGIVVAAFFLVGLVFSGDWWEKLGAASGVSSLLLFNLAAVAPLSSKGGLGGWAAMAPFMLGGILVMPIALLPEEWRASAIATIFGAPIVSALIAAFVVVALVLGSFLLSVRWFERRDL